MPLNGLDRSALITCRWWDSARAGDILPEFCQIQLSNLPIMVWVLWHVESRVSSWVHAGPCDGSILASRSTCGFRRFSLVQYQGLGSQFTQMHSNAYVWNYIRTAAVQELLGQIWTSNWSLDANVHQLEVPTWNWTDNIIYGVAGDYRSPIPLDSPRRAGRASHPSPVREFAVSASPNLPINSGWIKWVNKCRTLRERRIVMDTCLDRAVTGNNPTGLWWHLVM